MHWHWIHSFSLFSAKIPFPITWVALTPGKYSGNRGSFTLLHGLGWSISSSICTCILTVEHSIYILLLLLYSGTMPATVLPVRTMTKFKRKRKARRLGGWYAPLECLYWAFNTCSSCGRVTELSKIRYSLYCVLLKAMQVDDLELWNVWIHW